VYYSAPLLDNVAVVKTCFVNNFYNVTPLFVCSQFYVTLIPPFEAEVMGLELKFILNFVLAR